MNNKKENSNNTNKLEKPELSMILDGASSNYPILNPDLEHQRNIAADQNYSLDRRLEAFEDIIDSEIGDTNMTRARNIEREFGLRQIYLKFDGGNPTGTQKDRIAFAQVLDALRRGFDTISVATCGNYGAAISLAASTAGLECNIYIPEKYHTNRINEIVNNGAKIIRVSGDYENAVTLSQEDSIKKDYYDANPGSLNTRIQLRAYGEIANEIYDEIRDAPSIVALPVSNGTTLAGVYKGFLSLYRRGKTSKIPRIVAGSSYRKNPIIHSFISNSDKCEDLNPEKIRETPVNEPLINWRSIDGDLALSSIKKSNGWAAYASDKSMLTYSKIIREREGLSVLPASTAGLVAFIEKHKKNPLPNDRYVILITGRKT
jgi:threonine synthase